MLKVIDGIKKSKPDYYVLYRAAFLNCLNRVIDVDAIIEKVELIERKRLIYYGMKMVNFQDTDNMTLDELMLAFKLMDFIKIVIGTITPSEFENVFPIDKIYEGKRYETKDYFFTRNAMDKLGVYKEIGDQVEDLLWNYQNIIVTLFVVNVLSIASNIRRKQGQSGIMEEFCEEKGIDTYTMYNDEKGKKYLQNNTTGEVAAVKKPKPRYLNVVK
ncbi:hypothetical protein BK133_01015 [Paenibacillus sp. FSL H8-0548]|uniref:hypothetical protein n=1 Tax=Paenibacillus sp. FSL H8-0548 TaxID=1920422 RepID=UPI00096FCE15|nr:hypothetical protein [Paenibacillus sp. FSL H8-0548]OMF38815.1 hypothetical protein BK133_01015 [Paenibacillus sp. FSL H8-0548]